MYETMCFLKSWFCLRPLNDKSPLLSDSLFRHRKSLLIRNPEVFCLYFIKAKFIYPNLNKMWTVFVNYFLVFKKLYMQRRSTFCNPDDAGEGVFPLLWLEWDTTLLIIRLSKRSGLFYIHMKKRNQQVIYKVIELS